ncbi:MAG TPA: hypothetical protein PKU97_22620, partial [Kofleriaceae bacterium]|nr:hypothetical protein [Kofleriaceae bacterium]
MIEVACPTCGTPNPVDPAAAGGHVACGVCRSRIPVPRAAMPGAPPQVALRATAHGLGAASARAAMDDHDLPAPTSPRP